MSDAKAHDVHNRALHRTLRVIVTALGNPKPVDLLIFTESLVCGIFMLCVKLGGDEPVIDVFADGLRQRMAELRLTNLASKGSA